MKAYSLDLRERVMTAYEQGQRSIAQVAEQFDVGLTFVKRCCARSESEALLLPLSHGGDHQHSLTDKEHRLLRHRIKQQPDASLAELQEHLAAQAGVTVSLPTIHRSLRDSGLSRNKRA